MVCLGNICRSPLAHGIMQALIDKEGLDWEVDSAGTGNWHVGQSPDRRSVAVAFEHGVDISAQRAQWFRSHLFAEYDKILVMDKQNYQDVVAQARNGMEESKVSLFLEDAEVPDPYYDNNLFAPVYAMIEQRSKALLGKWLEEMKAE